MKIISKLIYFGIICVLVIVITKVAKAEDFFSVNSSIRLNVCGDLVSEFPEDCDNTDLNYKTCQSLGLTSGQLNCDAACDFETINCLGTPTPTLFPTATPTSVPTVAPTVTPTVIPTAIPTAVATVAPTITIPVLTPTKVSILLPTLLSYDFDNDGRIRLVELVSAVTTWLDNWKSNNKACDIDLDSKCGVSDFSVLLYYIDK